MILRSSPFRSPDNQIPSSRRKPMGAKLGIGLTLFPLLPAPLGEGARRADEGRRATARALRPCFTTLLAASRGSVQGNGGTYERLQGLLIDTLALVEVDCTPGVAFEAGVEEAGRVFQRGAPGEGQLRDIPVRLTGANDTGVRPHRNP